MQNSRPNQTVTLHTCGVCNVILCNTNMLPFENFMEGSNEI